MKKKKKLLPRKTLSTKNRTTLPVHLHWFLYYYLYYYLSISILLSIFILLFKGLFLFGFLIFQFENTSTPLYLCRDKIKGQSGKNATLTSTKTLPKKQDKFPINFQIFLSIYKLYCQNKNYIYKIKTQNFCFAKEKKPHRTREARVMRLVSIESSTTLGVLGVLGDAGS